MQQVPRNETQSHLPPLAAAKLYRDAWDEGGVNSNVAGREDVGKPLTGGGITKNAVYAIQEYLCYCRGIENETEAPAMWRGEWQRDFIDHVAANTYSAIQAPRRLGKSYCISLWLTACVLAGREAIIGLPTVTQGRRQLLRDLQINLHRLAVVFPELQAKRARVFNAGEVDYPFGGRVIVLSADVGAEKEGYGCDFLVMDEAHKIDKTMMGIFQPFCDDAIKAGHGKMVLLGVGEQKDSILEQARRGGLKTADDQKAHYACLKYPASELERKYPDLKSRFDNAKSMTMDGPGGYLQMYEMRPVRPGSGVIFKTPVPKQAFYCQGVNERRYYAGWDPGKRQDDSIVAVLEVGPSHRVQETAYNVVDYLQLPPGMEYPEQCREIKRWLNANYPQVTPQRFAIEVNGPGDPAADTMREEWHNDVMGFFTSDWFNQYYISEMEIGAIQGWFGCDPDDFRDELNKLTKLIDDDMRLKYEHSDRLAAAKCALYAAYQAA